MGNEGAAKRSANSNAAVAGAGPKRVGRKLGTKMPKKNK